MKLFIPSLFLIGSAFAGDELQAPAHSQNPSSGSFLQGLFPDGGNRIDLESDGLFSDDIDVIRSSIRFQQTRGPLRFRGVFGETEHDILYTPGQGTFTLPSERNERTRDYEIGIDYTLRSNLRLTASGRHSDGFSDHRSLWISEFYRQSFQFFPSYEEADPRSYSASIGLEWDYQANSTLAITAGVSRSNIVAGISIDPLNFDDVVIGEDELDTLSGSLRWETVINSRLKTQQTLRFSKTDGRDLRSQLQSDWAFAITDQWTIRAQFGAAHEDPSFEAFYGGLTLVYELNRNWQFDFGFRKYDDTGEVNSSNFNTSAPGFSSSELSFGVLWRGGSTSIRASVAMYDTEFDNIQVIENRVFGGLYQDRDFVAARLAISHQF